jgi:hypothetical protein
MGYSVGIGLTNDCNLGCAHCYRETGRVDYISLEQVKQICEAVPVASIGMGTGENALTPSSLRSWITWRSAACASAWPPMAIA